MKKLVVFFFSGALFATEYQFSKTPCTRMAHMLAAADAVAALPLAKQSLIDVSGQKRKSVYLVADAMRQSYGELCASEKDSGAVVYNLQRYVFTHMPPAEVKNEYKKSEGFYYKARANGSLKIIRTIDPINIAIDPRAEEYERAVVGAAARIAHERLGEAVGEGVVCGDGSECFLEKAYYHLLNKKFAALSDIELREKFAEIAEKH